MGSWNMVISGVGAHHNTDYAQDADKLFKRFVEDLKEAGHQIQYAAMTHGGRETVEQNQFVS